MYVTGGRTGDGIQCWQMQEQLEILPIITDTKLPTWMPKEKGVERRIFVNSPMKIITMQ